MTTIAGQDHSKGKSESEITAEITGWLTTLPGCWFYKVAARRPGKSGSQRTGVPDLVAVWRERTYWLEVKRPGGKLETTQEREIPRMLAAGARVEVVTSLEEVQKIMLTLSED